MTTIAWAVLVASEEITLLLAYAVGSIIYVLNVESGDYHGILLGHGGVRRTLLIYFMIEAHAIEEN